MKHDEDTPTNKGCRRAQYWGNPKVTRLEGTPAYYSSFKQTYAFADIQTNEGQNKTHIYNIKMFLNLEIALFMLCPAIVVWFEEELLLLHVTTFIYLFVYLCYYVFNVFKL